MTPSPSSHDVSKVQRSGQSKTLTDTEYEMAKAYVQVHSRKINAYVRDSEGSASARTELGLALAEAKGVAAALERMLA